MNRQNSTTSSDEPPSYEEATMTYSSLQKTRPTVFAAANFNATWDAVALSEALKIADKRKITSILCRRSLEQRLAIAEAYKADFKRDLSKEIKSKVGGKVKGLYLNLLMTTPELYCRHLKKTRNDDFIENVALAVIASSADFLESNGGDDGVLIEFLCSYSNSDIRKVCTTYQQLFSKRLEHRIREDKSDNVKKMMVTLAAARRDESLTFHPNAVLDDVETLRKQFRKVIPDELPIIGIMCTRSFTQIKQISSEYKKLAGISLVKSVKRNFSGTVKNALVAIIRTAINRHEYHARLISKAINNFMIDDRSLGRLIVARCEIDLMNIKEEFNRIFRMPIKLCLKNEIHGSFKLALLTLLGDVESCSRGRAS